MFGTILKIVQIITEIRGRQHLYSYVNVHCKKIRRFYGKIPGNQLPVHIPLFLRASACRTFLEIKKW